MMILSITILLLLGENIRAGPDPTSPIITIGISNVTVSQGQRAQVRTLISVAHSTMGASYCLRTRVSRISISITLLEIEKLTISPEIFFSCSVKRLVTPNQKLGLLRG